MANDNFVEILKDLKGKRAQSELEHTEFIQDIDSMIEKALEIIQLNRSNNHPSPSNATQNPKEKVKIEEILPILRKTKKTIHIDEICEIISAKNGSKVSRNMISMVISHYIRKFKGKAEIKKLKKFNYRIK